MAYDFSNITQQTLPRELMGYLLYPSFNIQHRLVFQQILNIFPQKDFWLWFPDGFF